MSGVCKGVLFVLSAKATIFLGKSSLTGELIRFFLFDIVVLYYISFFTLHCLLIVSVELALALFF